MAQQENNLIEKSKQLVWARFDTYTVQELRLLEVYLSRIDARHPESNTVEFTLSEYAKLMGLPDLRAEQVEPYLKHFVSSSVSIPHDPANRKRTQFTVYPLFCKGTCLYDETLHQYVISIACNPELKDVFFNLADSRYIRYRLRYTKDMKSQYGIRLYGMLRDWLPNGSYTVSVEQLRADLGATKSSYDVMRDFNRRVLDVAVADINDFSDLKVSYEKIKKGRTITDIRFKLSLKFSPKRMKDTLESATSEESEIEWFSEIVGRDISPISALRLGTMIKEKLKNLHPEIKPDQRDRAARAILQRAYNELLPPEKDPPPENPAGYLWSVLVRDNAIDEFLPYFCGAPEELR